MVLEEETPQVGRKSLPREQAWYMVRAELARRSLPPDTTGSTEAADPLRRATQMHGGRR